MDFGETTTNVLDKPIFYILKPDQKGGKTGIANAAITTSGDWRTTLRSIYSDRRCSYSYIPEGWVSFSVDHAYPF